MPSWKRKQPPVAKPEWVKEFADTIVEQVKKQEAPFQLPGKSGGRPNIPRNFATGRPYQGGNTLYLMAVARKRDMADNRWGTYNQIRQAGGQVRQGEKGVRVIYYKDRGAEVEKDENDKPKTDPEGRLIYRDEPEPRRHPIVRTFTVFNVEQADGLKLQPLAEQTRPEWEVHRDAEQLLDKSGIEFRHVPGGQQAYYSLKKDRVTLPDKDCFITASAYYQTAFHEAGHATGHPGRLDRKSLHDGVKDGFDSPSYAREELRAEISAMMTGDRVGIGHDPSRGAAYIKSWVQVLENDPSEIHRASADAQKMSDYLIERSKLHERIPEKIQEPEKQEPVTVGPTQQHFPSHAPAVATGKDLERDTGPSR